jgi:hypothetical protein
MQDGIAIMRTDDVPGHVDNHDYTATAEATHLQFDLAIRAALASRISFPRWLDVPMEMALAFFHRSIRTSALDSLCR